MYNKHNLKILIIKFGDWIYDLEKHYNSFFTQSDSSIYQLVAKRVHIKFAINIIFILYTYNRVLLCHIAKHLIFCTEIVFCDKNLKDTQFIESSNLKRGVKKCEIGRKLS